MRENLGGVVVRLGVFLAVCLLTAFLLIAVFGEVRFGDGKTYYAEFANVSNLRTGKLVRIAAVAVTRTFTTADGRDPSSTYHVAYYAVRGVLLECTSYLQGADLDLVRQLATRTVQKLRAL